MKIRFKKNYRSWLAGDVIDPGKGVASEYVRRGLAEPVVEDKKETAASKMVGVRNAKRGNRR